MIDKFMDFENAEIMDGWIKSYIKEFPIAGYGTAVKIEVKFIANKPIYLVTATRLESCD